MTRHVASLLSCLFCAALLLVSCSEDQPAGTAERLALLEQQVAEMEKRHTEERELMVRALEASSSRLDAVIAQLTGAPPKDGPSLQTPTEAQPSTAGTAGDVERSADPAAADSQTDAQTDAATNTGGFFDGIDPVQVIVIFLAVALLVLVVLVVFFPGPLRGSVPQMDYSAIEEEAIVGLQADPEPTLVRTPLVDAEATKANAATDAVAMADSAEPVTPSSPTIAARLAASSRYDDVADSGEPVAHELTLPLAEPTEVGDYASVLDSYLSTEPYILNEPAPQVALDDGELHLRFFALPTLSSTEHELLDAAVRRLQPQQPGPRRTAG